MKRLPTIVLSLTGIVAGLFFFLSSVCAFGGVFDSHSSGQGWYLLCALILLALSIACAFAVAKLNRQD